MDRKGAPSGRPFLFGRGRALVRAALGPRPPGHRSIRFHGAPGAAPMRATVPGAWREIAGGRWLRAVLSSGLYQE